MDCVESQIRCIGPRVKDVDLWIEIWTGVVQSSSRRTYWWRSNTSKHIAIQEGNTSNCHFSKSSSLKGFANADELVKEESDDWTEEIRYADESYHYTVREEKEVLYGIATRN